MKVLLLITMLCVCLQTRKLVFIQEVFRHGARYPINNHTWDNTQFAADQNLLGELTGEGKHMHYVLGKALYTRYWQALFANTSYENMYHQSQFYVRSTNVNRTLQSAQSQVLGWLEQLPPLVIGKQLFNFSLPPYSQLDKLAPYDLSVSSWFVFGNKSQVYHPVPIHTELQITPSSSRANPYDQGDMLLKFEPANCPNQLFWGKENMASEEALQIKHNPQVVTALKKLSEAAMQEVKFEQAYKAIDNYLCLKYLGKPYLNVFDNATLVDAYNFIIITSTIIEFFKTKQQLKAFSSRLLTTTLGNMRRALSSSGPKIVLYSAHDTTILMLLSALNLTNLKCLQDNFNNAKNSSDTCIIEYPTFASNIVFELWQQDDSNYTVQLIYNGQVRQQTLCGLAQACPLSTFAAWVDHFAISYPNEACGVREHYLKLYIVIGVLSFLIVTLVALQIHKRFKRSINMAIRKADNKEYVMNFEEKEHEHEQDEPVPEHFQENREVRSIEYRSNVSNVAGQ